MPATIPTMAMKDLSFVRAPEHITPPSRLLELPLHIDPDDWPVALLPHIPPLSSFLELLPLLQLDPEDAWAVTLMPQSMKDSIALEQFAQPQEPMAVQAMPCI